VRRVACYYGVHWGLETVETDMDTDGLSGIGLESLYTILIVFFFNWSLFTAQPTLQISSILLLYVLLSYSLT
jgi:hypothetical protein